MKEVLERERETEKAATAGEGVVQAKLSAESTDEMAIAVGDYFPAVLEIWPRSLVPHLRLEDLQDKNLLHLFYVIKVKSLKISENNEDAWIAKIDLVSTQSFTDTHLHLLELPGHVQGIPVFLSKIRPLKAVPGQESWGREFMIFHREKEVSGVFWGKKQKIIFVGAGILFCFLLTIFFMIWQKKRPIREKRRAWKKMQKVWHPLFLQAQKREDFEQIFTQRKVWQASLANQSALLPFLQILETYQYKKIWTESERQEVLAHFAEIREIWIQQDGI